MKTNDTLETPTERPPVEITEGQQRHLKRLIGDEVERVQNLAGNEERLHELWVELLENPEARERFLLQMTAVAGASIMGSDTYPQAFLGARPVCYYMVRAALAQQAFDGKIKLEEV